MLNEYQRKPSPSVNAVQWDGTDIGREKIVLWLLEHGYETETKDDLILFFDNNKEQTHLSPGDWLIERNGAVYTVSDDMFDSIYQKPKLDNIDDAIPILLKKVDLLREAKANTAATGNSSYETVLNAVIDNLVTVAALLQQVTPGALTGFSFESNPDIEVVTCKHMHKLQKFAWTLSNNVSKKDRELISEATALFCDLVSNQRPKYILREL